MRYYEKDGNEVNDFDEYDPTPYGGGYDLDLTYGRALAASGETCYAHCSSSIGEIDYERPHFSSQAQPSAYSDEHLQAEYGSYARHKHRPGHAHGGGAVAAKPEYGGRPHHEKPHSEEFGSGYGRRPESEHGSGGYGGRKPNYGDESESPRRTGYRRNEDEHERPSYQKRRDDDDDEGSRRKKYDSGDDEGSGRRKKYGKDDSDDDDDEKKHRRQRHQHKKHYDDD